MRPILACVLISLGLLFTACKKNEDVVDVSNLSGEYYKELVSSNNIKIIVIVTRQGNFESESFYEWHSFPGNNIIRVWDVFEHSGEIYGEKYYNLEKVFWYEIEEIEYRKEDVMALYLTYVL